MKLYYTYVLRSDVDNQYYIGWTDNLVKRLEMHQRGSVDAKKYRRPLALVYYEACLTKKRQCIEKNN